MIRQAHTYLVGAVGGATLIAIAIVVFAVLVSAQVFRDWPIAALGDSGGETAAVSSGKAASGAAAGSGDAGSGGGGSAAASTAAKRRQASGRSGDNADSVGAGGGVATADGGQGSSDAGAGPGGGAGQGGGSESASSPQTPSASSPGDRTDSSSSGGGGPAPPAGGGRSTGGTTPSTSGQVTDAVDNTVSQVDETALGGTLDSTGATAVTEGVVNGVAGPESAVGKVVDETVGAVGGLLHGDR